MAFPTILVNSATGSDTQASGAGPSTALFGTTDASFSGATVTLTAGTDLTNVATDGSHVLYLLTSTGVRFFKITAKAGSGGATPTVDVTPNPAGTSTGRTWAIGGKRASVGSSSSVLLFNQASTAGDAMPGWTVEMESGHTETISAQYEFRRAGNTTDGPITLKGTKGAGTKPVLTFTNNGLAMFPILNYQHLRDFELRNTNATKTASEGVRVNSSVTAGTLIQGLTINHATDKFWRGIVNNGALNRLDGCRIGNTASFGFILSGGATTACSVTYNEIHDCGDDAFWLNAGGDVFFTCVVRGNIIRTATGVGMRLAMSNNALGRLVIERNTIYDNSSDGIEITSDNAGHEGMTIENNIFAENGGFGLNFTTATAISIRANAGGIRNNAFFNNASGAYNPSDIPSEDEQTSDPTFTNAGSGDFRIGTNLKALGYPTSNIAGGSTRSFVDIGAAQREEPAGGGGMLRHPGMSGGTHA